MSKFLPILALILICSCPVSATYISLVTQLSREEVIKGNQTTLGIRLINSGDETAYNVQINLILPTGFSAPIIQVGNLVPNNPYLENVTVSIDDSLSPGTYPLGILTYYQDANGYPFSSPSFSTVVFQEAAASSVFGAMSPLTLSGSAAKELTLKIRNMDQESHLVKVTLFLPRELKTILSEKTVTLGAKEETTVSFEVSSFGALSGSSYAIFTSLNYHQDGLHYSSLTRGTITIVAGTLLGDSGEWWRNIPLLDQLPLILLILLIVVVVIFQLKK